MINEKLKAAWAKTITERDELKAEIDRLRQENAALRAVVDAAKELEYPTKDLMNALIALAALPHTCEGNGCCVRCGEQPEVQS